jgi:hypothetical protein
MFCVEVAEAKSTDSLVFRQEAQCINVMRVVVLAGSSDQNL